MSERAPLDAGFDLSIRGFGQAPGGARGRRGNNWQGFVEQSLDEDDVDDDGEDCDSDGDFDSGESDYVWLERDDFSSSPSRSKSTLEHDRCENRFPLLGIVTPARLGTGMQWTAGAGRPALARRSTHNRAECLGTRPGIADGTNRSRAREQFLHFGCR